MFNKTISVILALLVIIAGGIGYYSYTLNRQLDDLGEQMAAFEAKHAAMVDALSRELTDFREETAAGNAALEEAIGGAMSDIASLEEEVAAAREELAASSSRVDTLEAELGGLAESSVDISALYQQVSPSIVRISNWNGTIGSGVIYDDDAHVITANHVIEDLSPIHVILYDGRVMEATLVGSCPFSDIAVLKLEKNPGITPPPLADSGELQAGDPVIAVGSPASSDNPNGLKDTVTSGIISHLDRYAGIQSDTESNWVANLIQFDAAVNFGNSGGPLFNAAGEIAGIIIARIAPEEGDGIYWAVASNKAGRVAEAIIADGAYDYPWLGINIADITPQIAEEWHLDNINGVLVGGVGDDSPAGEGGILAEDIITAIDGTPISEIADLTSYLGEFTSPGDIIIITLLRGTTEIELPVGVGSREP